MLHIFLIYHQLLTTSSHYQLLLINIVTKSSHEFTNVGCLVSWWFSYPGFPLHHWLIWPSSSNTERESAGLLQGSRS